MTFLHEEEIPFSVFLRLLCFLFGGEAAEADVEGSLSSAFACFFRLSFGAASAITVWGSYRAWLVWELVGSWVFSKLLNRHPTAHMGSGGYVFYSYQAH